MIGIRKEDKSRWEARVPLVPGDLQQLTKEHGIEFQIQSSPTRRFSDSAYRDVGATIVDDLASCPIIMGVKEIPPDKLEAGKTYIYFSHTIKGQPANMPALRRLMELGCQLIDYEKIEDDQGRRLVFFGKFAGLAGMIDSLWALGERLKHEGIDSPFSEIRQAYHYDDLEHAKREIAAVGDRIRRHGLPEQIQPLICGFAGYGWVSRGAQEIFELLPVEEVEPDDVGSIGKTAKTCFKSVYHEEHLVERTDGSSPFDLQEYYTRPELYRSKFFPSVRHLTMLMNCIYWEPKYPRLATREQLSDLYGGSKQPRLRVIGDITCDIDGSVECTTRPTEPDSPVYVYDPADGQTHDGVAGNGPVVLAVDFLPCELPVDASNHFSQALSPFLPALVGADLSAPLDTGGLPPELQRATIVHQGQLTEPYAYLAEFV